MKRFLIISLLFLGLPSIAEESKITGDVALTSSAKNQLTNAPNFNGSSPYATLPSENDSNNKGGEAIFYSASSGGGTAGTTRLAPIADYHCALSKAGSSSSHASSSTLFKSGSYWWLQVVSFGPSGTRNGQAVCFPR